MIKNTKLKTDLELNRYVKYKQKQTVPTWRIK